MLQRRRREILKLEPMTARLRILVVLTSCFVGLALSASAHAVTTLYAKTGPGFVISLKTAAGKKVTRLPAGTYRIVVSDRNGFDNPHNFRLRGPGVNRATGVPFAGRRVWTVTLRPGVYRFLCDPHELAMHGSFRVTA